jgi:hypothetical protein
MESLNKHDCCATMPLCLLSACGLKGGKKLSEASKMSLTQNIVIIILGLLICFPVGLIFLWKHPTWTTRTKGLITGAWILLVIIGLASSGEQATQESSMPAQKEASAATRQVQAPPSPYDLRTVKWGMTKAEVLKEEQGLEIASQYDDLLTFRTQIDGVNAKLLYKFINDKLARAQYIFLIYHPEEWANAEFLMDFCILDNKLSKIYGKPAHTNPGPKDKVQSKCDWENTRTKIVENVYEKDNNFILTATYYSKEFYKGSMGDADINEAFAQAEGETFSTHDNAEKGSSFNLTDKASDIPESRSEPKTPGL